MAKLHVRNRFGVTPNEVLNSKDLSWKAKGLYWYIQSKPEDWEFAAARICNDSSDGEKATISWLKELEKAGFLERKRYQNELWRWEIDYILYEVPTAYNRQQEEIPSAENPPAENPPAENRQTYKEENTNKEIKRNISFADFWNLYPKKENKINASKKWEKLTDKSKTEVLEALQNIWNPYWVKKYGTAAGLPTDYIKAPDSWLLNRKWEEVPGKIANTAATTRQPPKPTGPTEEEKKRDREAAAHQEKCLGIYRNLDDLTKAQIQEQISDRLVTVSKTAQEAHPKQYEMMRRGQLIKIITEKYISTP